MDCNDQLNTAHALETSKNGEATTWRNPDTRHRYTVTPTRTYESASGPCREFTTIAHFDDGRHEIVRQRLQAARRHLESVVRGRTKTKGEAT